MSKNHLPKGGDSSTSVESEEHAAPGGASQHSITSRHSISSNHKIRSKRSISSNHIFMRSGAMEVAESVTVPSISGNSLVVTEPTNVQQASEECPAPVQAAQSSNSTEEVAAAAAAAAAEPDAGAEDKDSDKDAKKKKNRCATCRKKVGLTGFECRCGGLFCAVHRYSDKHDCSFNYREMGAQEIRRNNPVVVGEKIQKI